MIFDTKISYFRVQWNPALLSHCHNRMLRFFFFWGGGIGMVLGNITPLIKTITKFSNMIGYQQPDLSTHWTGYVSCLRKYTTFAHAVM